MHFFQSLYMSCSYYSHWFYHNSNTWQSTIHAAPHKTIFSSLLLLLDLTPKYVSCWVTYYRKSSASRLSWLWDIRFCTHAKQQAKL
jgi:hypothetical protein